MVEDSVDKVLIEQYYNCDQCAIEQINGRWFPWLYTYFRRLKFQEVEAENLSQETLVRVMATKVTRKRFSPEGGAFRSWILRIAHNLAADEWRRSNRLDSVERDDGTSLTDQLESADLDPLSLAMGEELMGDLAECLSLLSERQREAIDLRYSKDLSSKEAAGVMKITVTAYDLLIFRATKRLKVRLAAKGHGGVR